MCGKQGIITTILLRDISCDGRLNLPLISLHKLQILTLLGSRVRRNQRNTLQPSEMPLYAKTWQFVKLENLNSLNIRDSDGL